MRQRNDNHRSIQLYREHAASYDQSARFTMPLRRRAIALLNLLPWYKNRPYNAHPGDLWQPWDIVASHCDAFTWQSTQFGRGYIASGRTHSLPER